MARHSLFQGSLRDGRCIIFRNETTKKPGYVKLFDDVNLSETFKKFGIKVESTNENKSREVSWSWIYLHN